MREFLLPIELHLPDRVLRGELPLPGRRVVDLLESTAESFTLRRVHILSSSSTSRPEGVLGLVRVPVTEVLLALPGGPTIRAAPPAVWKPRRRVLSWVRLGSLAVSGTFHLPIACQTLVEALTAGGRFLVVTEAVVSSVGGPNQEAEAAAHPLVLVARRAIEAWAPLPSPPRRTHKHAVV